MDFGIDEDFVENGKSNVALYAIVIFILVVVLILIAVALLALLFNAGPLAIGDACTDNNQCDTENCSLGYCQLPGTTTGQEGAYCDLVNMPRCQGGLICLDHKCQSGILPLGSQCQVDIQCQSSNCSLGYCQPRGIQTGGVGAYCQLPNNPGCDLNLICDNNTCTSSSPEPHPVTHCPPHMILDNGQCFPTGGQPCAAGYCGQGNCKALPFLYEFGELNWQQIQITPGEVLDNQSSSSSVWIQTAKGIFELKRDKPDANWKLVVGPTFQIWANNRSHKVQTKGFRVLMDNELILIGTLSINQPGQAPMVYDGLFYYLPKARGRQQWRALNTWNPSLPGSQGGQVAFNLEPTLIESIIDVNFQYDRTQHARLLVLTTEYLYYSILPLSMNIIGGSNRVLTAWNWNQLNLQFSKGLLVYDFSTEPAVIVPSMDRQLIYVSGTLNTVLNPPGMVVDLTLHKSRMGDRYLLLLYQLNNEAANMARIPLNNLDQEWQALTGFYNLAATLSTWLDRIFLANQGICVEKNPPGPHPQSNCCQIRY